MKITKLIAENFMRLIAVEIIPSDDTIILRGKNSAGKSSIITAIWAALGGADAVPPKPVREGADAAYVQVELDNGLIVRRDFKADGSPAGTLRILNAEGTQKFLKPQEMLNSLIGRIAFDPLAFARMKPKEQREELLRVTKINLDLAAHERERASTYDARTIANREVTRLKALLEKTPHHEGAPEELISLADLMSRRDELTRENNETDRARERIEEIKSTIAELEAEAKRLAPYAERKKADLTQIQAELSQADEINARVRENERYREVLADYNQAAKTAGNLDANYQALLEKKEIALREASFPVPGLSIGEEGVLFNGIPLEQCSSGEQIKISIAIAMSSNPELRVILSREGSLLDPENLAIVDEMTKGKDYQLWLEVVGEGESGILIREGKVAAKPGKEDEVE